MTNMDSGTNSDRTSGVGAEFKRQIEEYWRIAIEGAGIGAWEINLRTGAFSCSRASARLLGVPRTTLATYEDVLALIHPEDRQSTSDETSRCIDERGDCEVVYRVLRQDGTISWPCQRAQVNSDQDSVPTYIRGVLVDISKQKRAESELKTGADHLCSIVEIVPDAMIVINDALNDFMIP